LREAVEAIARVAEPGDDVAALVEALIDRGGHDRDRDVQAGELGIDRGDSLWRREQADCGDVVSAALCMSLELSPRPRPVSLM